VTEFNKIFGGLAWENFIEINCVLYWLHVPNPCITWSLSQT